MKTSRKPNEQLFSQKVATQLRIRNYKKIENIHEVPTAQRILNTKALNKKNHNRSIALK